MRIATFIEPQLSVPFERAVTAYDLLFSVKTWLGLGTSVRKDRVDIAVIDPFVRKFNEVDELIRFAGLFPDLPILVYTAVGPGVARSITALSHSSLRHVVLHPFEGTSANFREEMTDAVSDTVSSHFVEAFLAPLEFLPMSLRRGVERMLTKPEQFKCAGDLALYSEMAPLQVYRHFQRAHLCSPKLLLKISRLVRFYGHTKNSGMTAQDAAKRLGYADCRVLSGYCRESLHVQLPDLRGFSEARVLAELTEVALNARH